MTDEASKIIIDEDWKSQVQAEKEALARGPSETASAQSSAETTRHAQLPLPEASLTTLVTMLATQATIALGAGPNPMTGKVEVNLAEARYLIDLLQVLEEKTRGNCTPQETTMFARLLDDLRLAFVSVQSMPKGTPDTPSGG